MSLWYIPVQGFYLMIPALLPNSAAVLFGGGTPMDFGRSWKGERILGDGKTWRGFVGGIFAGVIIGIILMSLAYLWDRETLAGFGHPPRAIFLIFMLSFGSLMGDVIGSFIKRRMGKGRGVETMGLDQYDLFLGTLLFLVLFEWNWLYSYFIEGPRIWALATMIIIIPLLHRGVNIVGYKMGKKDVPW